MLYYKSQINTLIQRKRKKEIKREKKRQTESKKSFCIFGSMREGVKHNLY